jgi:hypothetical protein
MLLLEEGAFLLKDRKLLLREGKFTDRNQSARTDRPLSGRCVTERETGFDSLSLIRTSSAAPAKEPAMRGNADIV